MVDLLYRRYPGREFYYSGYGLLNYMKMTNLENILECLEAVRGGRGIEKYNVEVKTSLISKARQAIEAMLYRGLRSLRRFRRIAELALREDLGSGDITSRATIPPDARSRAVIPGKARRYFGRLESCDVHF